MGFFKIANTLLAINSNLGVQATAVRYRGPRLVMLNINMAEPLGLFTSNHT